MIGPYPQNVPELAIQPAVDKAPGPPAGLLAAIELAGQAATADWFGRLVLQPIDAAAVQANCTGAMLAFIAELGDELGAVPAAQAIIACLRSQAPGQVARRLGHFHVMLFDGVSGPQAVSLCESSYAGEGGGRLQAAPFVDMRAVLRDLDVSVDAVCHEPADHLAIEMAALAEAMRQGNPALIAQMVRRLSRWIPAVAEAVSRAGLSNFHTALFALLDAFVADLGSSLGQGCKSLSGVSDV
jgi:TorA-specific chaperone